MQGEIIAFLTGGAFVGILSYLLSRMLIKARVDNMISESTIEKIKDLEFNNSYLKRKIGILTKERNIAIEYSRQTLDERDSALIMLSEKITKIK